VTRSEEELDVGTVQRPREVVRLTKRTVVEEKQVTVPVRREEVVLERRPVTDATETSRTDESAAMADEPSDSPGDSMTLYEEELVVTKRVVPRERVRLAKDVRIEDQTVEAEIRKEAIEIEREPVDPGSSA
jgi:stress response protein YsnF